MNKHVHATWVSAVVVGLGVAGCGGGGDGEASPDRALVPLSAANYGAIADSSTRSVASSDEIFAIAESFTPVSAASARAASAALAAPGGLDALARRSLDGLKSASAGRAQPAAVETEIEACGFSGSLRIDADDADNNRALSAGDRISLTAINCVAAAGEPAITGSFSIRIRSARLDRMGDLTSGVLEFSFGQFGSNGLVLNGAAVLSVSSSELVLDANGLSASDGVTSWVYDYALTANLNANTLSVVGPITVNGSTYVLATPAVIRFNATHPVAGTLRVSDGHGNRVDVQMGSTSYTASLYLAGDEVVDASTTRPW